MRYASDLSDEEWELVKDIFKKRDKRGVKGKHKKRDIVDAILYVAKTGCQWYNEQTALNSVFALFAITREVLKKHGRDAGEFSKIAIVVLKSGY